LFVDHIVIIIIPLQCMKLAQRIDSMWTCKVS